MFFAREEWMGRGGEQEGRKRSCWLAAGDVNHRLAESSGGKKAG